MESCSGICVHVPNVWSSGGEPLEILHPDWREDLLIGAITMTVMTIAEAVLL